MPKKPDVSASSDKSFEDILEEALDKPINSEKLSNLVNKELELGTHQVTWEANDLPSGIYFYRIETGDFSCVKKMVLIR